eukprot:364416-Chlamydomonas_euryale.AAC.8
MASRSMQSYDKVSGSLFLHDLQKYCTGIFARLPLLLLGCLSPGSLRIHFACTSQTAQIAVIRDARMHCPITGDILYRVSVSCLHLEGTGCRPGGDARTQTDLGGMLGQCEEQRGTLQPPRMPIVRGDRLT